MLTACCPLLTRAPLHCRHEPRCGVPHRLACGRGKFEKGSAGAADSEPRRGGAGGASPSRVACHQCVQSRNPFLKADFPAAASRLRDLGKFKPACRSGTGVGPATRRPVLPLQDRRAFGRGTAAAGLSRTRPVRGCDSVLARCARWRWRRRSGRSSCACRGPAPRRTRASCSRFPHRGARMTTSATPQVGVRVPALRWLCPAALACDACACATHSRRRRRRCHGLGSQRGPRRGLLRRLRRRPPVGDAQQQHAHCRERGRRDRTCGRRRGGDIRPGAICFTSGGSLSLRV